MNTPEFVKEFEKEHQGQLAFFSLYYACLVTDF